VKSLKGMLEAQKTVVDSIKTYVEIYEKALKGTPKTGEQINYKKCIKCFYNIEGIFGREKATIGQKMDYMPSKVKIETDGPNIYYKESR